MTAPIRILDGGLATELEARGFDLSDRLWSARVLLSAPEAILAVHRAYFEAGATVATTASYQATVPGFAEAGLDQPAALAAIRRSVSLAVQAREAHRAASAEAGDGDQDLVVAGSVGPYGAMLADGSEYRGDYDPGATILRDVHAPRMDALLEAGADLLALETIPTVREAEVLVRLVEERGATAWLSYQCRDDRSTAAGESIETAVAVAQAVPGIVAIGVNCTAPRHVAPLLERAASVTSTPLIAYPNGGDSWDPGQRRWVAEDSSGAFDAARAEDWADAGAQWIGGCCGTGPIDIARMRAALAGRQVAAS
jgi:homocysteine S-methyltransferase